MVKVRKITRNRLFYLTGFLLIIGAVLAVLLFTDSSDKDTAGKQDKDSSAQGENNSSSDNQLGPALDAEQKNPNSVQSNADSSKQSNQSSSSANVTTPSGNFVSSHVISSGATSIESICTTNPGANCQISFKMGGVIKSLEGKVTGTSGTVYWVWSPSSIGIYSGKWEITATASLNGTSKTATDPMQLEVKI